MHYFSRIHIANNNNSERIIKRGKDTNATEIWLTARIDFSGVDALEK